MRALFKLTRQNVLLYNPASELELPRLEHRLPKHVLTASEAEAVLAQPDTNDPLGVRDRAILETLYSTGMRRMGSLDREVPRRGPQLDIEDEQIATLLEFGEIPAGLDLCDAAIVKQLPPSTNTSELVDD